MGLRLVKVVLVFLDGCARLLQRPSDYYTPLHIAIATGRPNVATHLITKCRCDIHAVAGVSVVHFQSHMLRRAGVCRLCTTREAGM